MKSMTLLLSYSFWRAYMCYLTFNCMLQTTSMSRIERNIIVYCHMKSHWKTIYQKAPYSMKHFNLKYLKCSTSAQYSCQLWYILVFWQTRCRNLHKYFTIHKHNNNFARNSSVFVPVELIWSTSSALRHVEFVDFSEFNWICIDLEVSAVYMEFRNYITWLSMVLVEPEQCFTMRNHFVWQI